MAFDFFNMFSGGNGGLGDGTGQVTADIIRKALGKYGGSARSALEQYFSPNNYEVQTQSGSTMGTRTMSSPQYSAGEADAITPFFGRIGLAAPVTPPTASTPRTIAPHERTPATAAAGTSTGWMPGDAGPKPAWVTGYPAGTAPRKNYGASQQVTPYGTLPLGYNGQPVNPTGTFIQKMPDGTLRLVMGGQNINLSNPMVTRAPFGEIPTSQYRGGDNIDALGLTATGRYNTPTLRWGGNRQAMLQPIFDMFSSSEDKLLMDVLGQLFGAENVNSIIPQGSY
jgi:hypothetical protein